MTAEDNTFPRETSFFGFHPLSFVDDVIDASQDYSSACVETLEYFLKEKLYEKLDPARRDVAISEGCEQVLKVLANALDKSFDKFELYALSNIFHIPTNLVLPGEDTNTHTSQTNSSQTSEAPSLSQEEELALDKELYELRVKINQTKLYNERLRQQEATLIREVDAYRLWNSQLKEMVQKLNPDELDVIAKSLQELGKVVSEAYSQIESKPEWKPLRNFALTSLSTKRKWESGTANQEEWTEMNRG